MNWAYPRNQRLFLLALLGLGTVFLAFTWWTNRTVPPTLPPLDPELRRAAARLRAGEDAGAMLTKKPSPGAFPFDPNTVSRDQLRELGLSDKQAAGWLKYRGNRPRAFRRPEDIGKLFVLSEQDKERLIPLAVITGGGVGTGVAGSGGTPTPTPTSSPTRFPFDPNTISADSLQLLGFSPRQAASFLKYRSYRTPTFRTPDDLKRFRAADPALLAELTAYVTLPPPTPTATPTAYRPPPTDRYPPPASFDINATSPEDWLIFPGIGDYRASRIVKFRDALGGFVSVEQVGTAYALPDSLFQVIRPYLTGGGDVRTLPINRAEEADLAAHPYISRKLATVIVRYRQNHGPFTDVADLSRIRILDRETISRIAPYLDFSPP